MFLWVFGGGWHARALRVLYWGEVREWGSQQTFETMKQFGAFGQDPQTRVAVTVSLLFSGTLCRSRGLEVREVFGAGGGVQPSSLGRQLLCFVY